MNHEADINQCDGCRSNLALHGDMHKDANGRAVMLCQRGRYAGSTAGAEPDGWLIRFKIDGEQRKLCCGHNCVADFREFDPEATSEPLFTAVRKNVTATIAAAPMTADRIDYIAELVVKGMPDGLRGFCTMWGWQQFARALLEVCRPEQSGPTEEGLTP